MAIRLDEISDEVSTSPLTEGAKAPSVALRLDDVEGMQSAGSISQKDFDFASLSFSEEEANALKAKGNIGFFEQALRMKMMERIPVLGLPVNAYEAAALRRAIGRLQKDEYGDNTELMNRDVETARKAIRYAGEEQIRGFTLGAKIYEGATQLPAYMIEFGLSSLFAAPGSAAVVRGAGKALVGQVANKALRKALVGTAAWGTRAAIRTGTVFAPRVVTGTYQNEVNLNLIPTEKGFQLNEQAQSAPVTSFLKALGDTAIEVFSEEAGSIVFNPLLSKMAGAPLLAKVGKKISEIYKRLHPNDALGKLFTKAGWDGFIGEVGEEILGDQMRAVFNVQDFGAKDGNVLDRMIAAIPDGDEMMVMMGVLAVPGAAHVAAQGGLAALDDYRAKKQALGQEIKPFSDVRTLAQELKQQGFDPVRAALKEALVPLPQAELSKEQLEPLHIKQRDGGIKFEESKPAPEREAVKAIVASQEFKEADREKQMQMLIKGRTAELDVQRVDIEDRMTALEKDVEQLSKEEVSPKIVEGKKEELSLLSKQLMSVHAQLSDVIDSTAEELSREKILLPGESLEQLRGKARQVGERMERARVETVFRNIKAQAEERRTALVKYLRARLPGSENAGIREKYTLRAAKDMTEEKLQKFFKEVETLRNTVRAKQLRERAESILEKMLPQIVDGVKKGRFANANIQKLADEIVRIAQLSAPAAEKEILQVGQQMAQLDEMGESESEAADELRYKAGLLSKISGLEQRNADQLEEAIQVLSKQLAQFQTGRDVVKELRKAQRKVEEQSIVSEIKTVSWDPKSGVLKVLQRVGKGIGRLYQFSSFHLEEFWRDLGTQRDSFIGRMIVEPLSGISRHVAALQISMDRPVRQVVEDIYGVSQKKSRDFVKFLVERMSLDKSEDPTVAPYLKKVVLNSGIEKDFKLSRWDVMYWYALAYQEEGVQDPEAYEILTGENELQAIRDQVQLELGEGSGTAADRDIGDLRVIRDMMDFSEPNMLVDTDEGKTRLSGGAIANFLKGERKQVVDGIIKKLEAGEQLTEKQREKVQQLLEGYRKEVPSEFQEGEVTEEDIEAAIAKRAESMKGNAIPANVLEEMFATLIPQDRQFAMAMRKIFTSFWSLINPVYSRATGIDLTQILSYIPWIRKMASIKSVEEMFTQYAMIEAHITPFPGSVKERRSTSTAPFAQVGLMDVFMGFRDTMSHWVATRDITARIQGYLRNRSIRDAINAATDGVQDKATGEWRDGSFIGLMDFHLKGIASRGRTDNAVRPPAMDLLRRNLSRYLLSKPKQFMVQMTSSFAAIQKVGHIEFVKGVMSFWRDPVGSMELMNKALSLHNRYQNIMIELKEVQDLIRLQRNRFRDKLNWIDKYAFVFTQLGDRAAISLGGWAVFKSTYNKTKSLEKAYDEFDTYVHTLQQSALREHQSAATVGPSRYLFQFISAVSQYGRAYYRSWSDLFRNPSSENIQIWARTMVVFHLYIPTALWGVSQIGLPPPEDEEEEEKRKKQRLAYQVAGPFSGLWILGIIADFAAEALTGEKGYDSGPAVLQAMNKTRTALSSAIKKAMDEDADPEDVLESVFKVEKQTTGLTMGVPGWFNDGVQQLYLHSQGEGEFSDVPGLLYGHSIEMLRYKRGQ